MKAFADLFDGIVIIVAFFLAIKMNSFFWFLLLGLSPRAWR